MAKEKLSPDTLAHKREAIEYGKSIKQYIQYFNVFVEIDQRMAVAVTLVNTLAEMDSKGYDVVKTIKKYDTKNDIPAIFYCVTKHCLTYVMPDGTIRECDGKIK
jgi:hypothetical protein